MDKKQDLREQTNPVFNTAKSMLLHLCIAGDKDAAVLAEKFGIDADSLLGTEGDRQEVEFLKKLQAANMEAQKQWGSKHRQK